MEKPYVISAELELVDSDIINTAQVDNFRENLDSDLRQIGKDTVWVPSCVMRDGVRKLLDKTALPIVSLDDRYIETADRYLGISRGIDEDLNDAGYVPRAGYESITKQLENLSDVGKEIIIVDDVVFSGEIIVWLAKKLRSRHIKIGGVVCGVAIGQGIDKLICNDIDIDIDAATAFDSVDDEICERDFAVVSGSGRRIDSISANALYFDNKNGRPDQWASLPPSSTETFCMNSLKRNVELIKPGVPMRNIGNFLGYQHAGTVREQLINRMEKL